LAALAVRTHVPALRAPLPAILVSVVVLNLFAANRPLNVVPVFEAFPYLSALDPIRAETGFFRVKDDFQLPSGAGCIYGFQAAEGSRPFQLATYARFTQAAPERVQIKLLGVRFVVTWIQNYKQPELAPVAVASVPTTPNAHNQAGVTKVFRFTANSPQRGFLTHAAVVGGDDAAIYALLSEPGFDPLATVVLSAPVTVDLATRDQVAVESDVPGKVRFQVDTDAPGVLVFSEAYFPGWRATVDGRATPVLRADGALLAAAVPAGSHQVEFVYQPAALRWGGLISGAALLFALSLVAVPFRWRRST
jgi:hypothetical protein